MTAPFPLALDSDAAYVSPAHLRTPFRSFLVSFDKGIYWLRTPQDTGKTQFVRGIVARRPPKAGAEPEGIDSAISSGTRVIAVALEPGAGPQAFAAALKSAFDTEFGITDEASPAPPAAFSDPAQGEADFAGWLARLGAMVQEAGGKRLLICVDALDLASTDGPVCVLDILPPIARMPPGVVLLLTSRPKEAWPADLYAKAEAKFAIGPAVSVQEFGLDDADYLNALRQLFQTRLRPVLRARAVATLQALLENKASFEKGGRDARLTADPTLRDGLKDDWKKLTNKYPRYSSQLMPVAVLVPLLDQFDQLWVDVLDRADRRFKYVHLIIQRIAEGALQMEEVAGLPRGAELDARLGAAAS